MPYFGINPDPNIRANYALPTGTTGISSVADLLAILVDLGVLKLPATNPGVTGAVFFGSNVINLSVGPTGPIGLTNVTGLTGA